MTDGRVGMLITAVCPFHGDTWPARSVEQAPAHCSGASARVAYRTIAGVSPNGAANGGTETDADVVVAVFIEWGDGHQSDTSSGVTTTLNRILDAVLDFVHRVLITVGRTLTVYCPECPKPIKS